MRGVPTQENLPDNTRLPLPRFHHACGNLAFEDIQDIRLKLSGFLRNHNTPAEHIGNLLLVVTEVLSNLIKHPESKAGMIEITLSLSGKDAIFEFTDDSSPFADFLEKMKEAETHMQAPDPLSRRGYGLVCIRTLCGEHISYQTADGKNHFKCTYALTHKAAPLERHKAVIFLIDDDPISIDIHKTMLEEIYDVISFEKAQDALAAFAQHKPDIIISDLTMPEMDGIALRRALANEEDGNSTPFIFLSGHKDNENNPYISQLGVDDFLCKPITSERLHTVVTRLLNRSRQIRASVQGRFHQDITAMLRPSLPAHHGPWRITTHSMMAEAGGGDFVLHHQNKKGLMAVLVDVMGHGRQAKFFSYVYAGYLRSMFRAQATTLDAPRFLKHLSQSVSGDPLLESVIMTCQCFQLTAEGLLKVSSAGHPPPILLRAGKAEEIAIAGPLPGLAGDNAYDMVSLALTPGDKVFFMTDGYLEAFDRRGMAAEKFINKIEKNADLPTPELAENLWRAFLLQQQKSAQKDDATLILIEYGGQNERE